MRPVFKRGILVIVCVLVSIWFFGSAFATGMLGTPGDPSVDRYVSVFLFVSFAFLAVAIWQLVIILRRYGSENLL